MERMRLAVLRAKSGTNGSFRRPGGLRLIWCEHE
jgi:hypothetical protein